MTKKQQEQQVFEKKNFMTPVKHKNFASLQRVILGYQKQFGLQEGASNPLG